MPLAFDPADPIPRIPLEEQDLTETRRHAVAVDAWLGLSVEAVEKTLPPDLSRRTGQQLWQQIPAQRMLTPYVELRAILEVLALPDGATLVDLGAAYGRLGVVAALHFPTLACVGYEYVLERVLEGRRALSRVGGRATLERADLSARVFKPPEADAYFIFDYGTREAIEKTLEDLRAIARRRAIAVVGRGRAIRDAVEHRERWLTDVVAPRHFLNFSIYRNR